MTDIRRMVEDNTILRATVGSQMRGMSLGEGDRDEMGVCIEDIQYAIGLQGFDQYVYRSATERTGNPNAKSEPGDLDLTIYSLKKYIRLALKGNPSVIELLFVPPQHIVQWDARGSHLQELAPYIVSRSAGKAFIGYMVAQRQRLVGERGQRDINRRDLMEQFGYDTKYASHVIRLGYQGIELLKTGRLTLPFVDPVRQHLLDIRNGKFTEQEILTEAGELERELEDLLDTSPLLEQPDFKYVEAWMVNMYLQNWKASEPRLF